MELWCGVGMVLKVINKTFTITPKSHAKLHLIIIHPSMPCESDNNNKLLAKKNCLIE